MTAQDRFWDRRSARYDTTMSKHDDVYDRRIEATRALLSPADTVLDLGCASGEIGLDIAAHVKALHGIDISAAMIDLANTKAATRGVRNATFGVGDVYDTDLDEPAPTAALAFFVLHLVDDPARVLARLHALIAPGGLLICETPCLGAWNPLLRGLIRLAGTAGLAPPIQRFTPTSLDAAITAAGFQIEESRMAERKAWIRRVVARKSARPAG